MDEKKNNGITATPPASFFPQRNNFRPFRFPLLTILRL
jgi:hypothetical protein